MAGEGYDEGKKRISIEESTTVGRTRSWGMKGISKKVADGGGGKGGDERCVLKEGTQGRGWVL